MLQLGLAVAGVVFVLDQLTKAWILYGVRLQEVGKIELSPIFDLTFVRNFGVSFGLFREGGDLGRWLLVLLSLGIAGMFLNWLRTTTRLSAGLALGLIVGGALGNVIDRIRFGYVVDFLDFSGMWFPYVFNVADAAITVGAGLLIYDYLVHGDGQKKAEPQT